MTLDLVSQFLASIALIFFIVDAIAQLLKLYKAKSSEEISMVGLAVRVTGMSFFVLRFGVIGDQVLFFGQSVFLLIMLAYGVLVIRYRKNVKAK